MTTTHPGTSPGDPKPILLIGTLVFVALCWLAPPAYLAVLWSAKLNALPIPPMRLSSVPWKEPFVAALVGLSALTLAGVYGIGRMGLTLVRRRGQEGKPGAGAIFLVSSIVAASLLETVAIYGLVLSFAMRGADVLPLTLLMTAAAPLGHLVLWPGREAWRRSLDAPSPS